jgi:DNA-binding NtrC family response regulator
MDDDAALLGLMEDILTLRSWRMVPLLNAATAFSVLRETAPDALVLDIRLIGGHTGWELLRAVKADHATDAIPVVVWSSDVRSLDDRRDWLVDHDIPVLEKPFDIDDLFSCLDDVMGQGLDSFYEQAVVHG